MTQPTLCPAYRCFVGVDVAAETATAVWQVEAMPLHGPVTFAQTSKGILGWIAQLQQTAGALGETLIVLEATSSYWITLATTLHAAGYHVSVVNPAHAHHFAKSQGQRAKTDNADARMLCLFAVQRQPACWTPPPQVYHELRQRLMARDVLIDMRQQARNHRHALLHWPVVVPMVVEQLDLAITTLDSQIATLTADVNAILGASAWAASATLLRSITGVGQITTAWLLVGTLNFTISPSVTALTAYVGLAPMPRESGKSVRGRPRLGHTGNARLRTALFLAALSASRYNPVIKAYYERLRAAGKPSKVARCAAARKLLHIVWAVITKRQPFDPAFRVGTCSP